MTVPLRFVNNPWKIEERNLCFVNASTQAFLNLELTKKHFLGKSFSDLAKKPISTEIKRLLGCNPRSVESLKELRRLVGISRGKLYTGTQEDSHEFFTFLLNSLRREGDEYLFGEFSNGIELTTTNFASSNEKCDNGHFYSPSAVQNDMTLINLELYDLADSTCGLSLQDLINSKYSTNSNVELDVAKCNKCCPCANNKVRCSNQGVCVHRAVKKTVSLFSLPSVVMVVLPKDGNLNVIPESQITLTVDGCGQVFKLKSVVDHIGADRNSGHYTATILSSSGWLKCDDTESAKRVQGPGNKNNATYFYERVDTFSEAATRGIASKSFNVESEPVTVKKSATTTSTATSKTQNIKKNNQRCTFKNSFCSLKVFRGATLKVY